LYLSIIYIYIVLECINLYNFFLLISNHFLRIYLRYIYLYKSFPAEIPASMFGQGKLLKHWLNISCGLLSNFLRKFPQVSFLWFLKSSWNNYPRRYYLGTLILGKIRRKQVSCGNFRITRRKIEFLVVSRVEKKESWLMTVRLNWKKVLIFSEIPKNIN